MASNVYLVYGEDEYLVGAKARQIVEKLVPPDKQAFGLELIEASAGTVDEALKALAACLESLQTLGFFGDLKVTWLREANFLSDTVVGRSAPVKERVERLAAMIKEGLGEGQILVVSAGKVDKRYALYKACKDRAEIHEFARSDKPWAAAKDAAERLGSMLERLGLKMRPAVRRQFLDRVGTDTRQIVSELRKLAVYGGDSREVTAEAVDLLTCRSREAIAWDLADAVGERNLDQAVQVLRRLLFQKVSPVWLVMGLGTRIRELIVYREAMERGWCRISQRGRNPSVEWGDVPPAIEAALGGMSKDPRDLHWYRAGRLAAQARRHTLPELFAGQKKVLATHSQLVTTSFPPNLALELLLMELLRKRKSAGPAKAAM